MSGLAKCADDWICPDADCKNVNYARRTHCHRCQVERKDARKATSSDKKLGTEIGKQAADKSRGLFSAEDWQCTQCANVNWSRRQSCNMCNAPKFHDVEERTGTGGGYNERMNVEYKEKVPSDNDEFDEFGRRKKKSSTTTQRKQRSPSLERRRHPQARVKEEDDDDDDDDEDDEEGDEEGDLSKYNLWDSDDAKKEDPEKNSKSRPSSSSASKMKEQSGSRSRSRSSSPSHRSRHGSSNRRKRKYSRSSSSSSASSTSSTSSTSSGRHRRRRRR